MKQHITTEQLKELSPKATNVLRKWMRDNYLGHPTREEPTDVEQFILNQRADLIMSIGQMIEFLDEHSKSGHDYWIDKINDWNYDAEIYWIENAPKRLELCDALWEAVKEVLNG